MSNTAADISAGRERTLLDALLDMPEGEKWEIIDGALYMQAGAASPHSYACTGLTTQISMPFHYRRGGPGGWWILSEARILSADPERFVLEPDIAGWRRERMPRIPRPFIDVAPDWVCEVLSPSTESRDRGLKRDAYAQMGVRHYWLVDPQTQRIEVMALSGGTFGLTAEAGDAPCRLAPFDAVDLDPGDFWMPEQAVRHLASGPGLRYVERPFRGRIE